MKNKKPARLAGVGLLSALAAFAVASFSGCDVVNGLTGLTIAPSSAQFIAGSGSNWVDFVAGGVVSNDLALPLQWSVSKPELGYIGQSSGYKARYFGNDAAGQNIVTARDQYGNEGSAVVRQIRGGAGLLLAKTLGDADGLSWIITVATASTGPYTWWVRDSAVGDIEGETSGASALYSITDETGSNDIYVMDAAGNVGVISIP